MRNGTGALLFGPVAAFLWFIASIALLGCSNSAAPIPDSKSIRAIRVRWAASPKSPYDEFDVHEHFDQIIDALKPNRVDPQPARWEVIGSLRIATAGGETRIALFHYNGGELALKIGDTYYRGGSDSKMNELMTQVAPK